MSDPHAGAGTQVVRGVGALAAETLAEAAALVAALARQAGQGSPAARAESIGARASALSVSNEMAFLRASRQLDAADHGQADDAGRSRERGRAPPMSRCRSARSRATSSCSQPTSLRVPWRNGAWISGASFSLRPGHVPARRCSCARTRPSTPMTPAASRHARPKQRHTAQPAGSWIKPSQRRPPNDAGLARSGRSQLPSRLSCARSSARSRSPDVAADVERADRQHVGAVADEPRVPEIPIPGDEQVVEESPVAIARDVHTSFGSGGRECAAKWA